LRILNELEYAENMTKKGFLQKKYEFELKILSKYYYSQGHSADILKQKIKDFCTYYLPDFSEVKYFKMINRVCSYGEKNSLFIVKPVKITKKEFDKIRSLNNLKVEKIAFVLLVLSNINRQSYILYMRDKIKDIKKNNENKKIHKNLPKISLGYYVAEKINTLFNLSKIYLSKAERNEIIKILIDEKLIKMNKQCIYKIEFVNHNTNENVLILDNFEDFVLEYDRLLGDNIGHCETCKKPIRITSGRQKYCRQCWKELRKEQIRINVQNYKKRRKGNQLEIPQNH
jgi:hypothetical protein